MSHVAKVRIKRNKFEMAAHDQQFKKPPTIMEQMNTITKKTDELKKLLCVK